MNNLSNQHQETANTLTHAFGALLSAIGLIALLLKSSSTSDIWFIVSSGIFGVSMLALYLASTLYHAETCPTKKTKLKMFDHCAIYLLIAGSYTPFLLVSMREGSGWLLFFVVWGIALFGIGIKLKYKHRLKALRVTTYLVMGWLVLLTGDELKAALPKEGFNLLLAGGAVYTLGVVFYLAKKIPYSHAIWHAFVLGGSACHFFSIYYYISPASFALH